MDIKASMKLARTIANLTEDQQASILAVVGEIRAARSTVPAPVAVKRGPKAKVAAAVAADRPKRKYTKRTKVTEVAAAIAAPVQH